MTHEIPTKLEFFTKLGARRELHAVASR
jgi:hypothetical protein